MVGFAHLMEVPSEQGRGCLVEPLPRYLIEKIEQMCEKRKASHWKTGKIQSAWPVCYTHTLWRQTNVTGETLEILSMGNRSCIWLRHKQWLPWWRRQYYDFGSGLAGSCLIASDNGVESGTLGLSCSQADILGSIWHVQSVPMSTKHLLQVLPMTLRPTSEFSYLLFPSYPTATLLHPVIVDSFFIFIS